MKRLFHTISVLFALGLCALTIPFVGRSSSPQAGMFWLLRVRTFFTLVWILVSCTYIWYRVTQP